MRCSWLLAITLLLFQTVSAGAQEPGIDAEYDAALTRALGAHAAGDYAHAEEAMRLAHSLSPNARTLRGLGVILYAEGRYVEAIEPLESALASQVRPLNAELRQGVEELLGRVWQRVARLLLRVEPVDSRVLIDGLEPVRHAEELVLTSGAHQIEISAPGRLSYSLTLHSQPGSRDSLHVVLAALPVAQPAAARSAPRTPDASARTEGAKPSRIARNSLLIAGGALLAAGGAIWITGFVRYRGLVDECRPEAGGCDESTANELYEEERIRPLGTTGAVLLSVGAAALLTAGALELWRFRSRRPRSPVQAVRLKWRGPGVGLHASF